ncbi:MAG: nitroreductase family protein [Candidatus Coatesbacteria bacterium]|nr:MAG: nitroreductase family protein [Candidatus Coatesbacteria bacterium]
MELYDLVMRRRSVRNFRPDEVPGDIVEKLVNAAASAPTGCNIQPLSVVTVQEAAGRAKLGEMIKRQPWVKNAPLSMIFCLDFWRLKRWAELSGVEFRGHDAFSHFLLAYADVMCAAQTVVLLAESLGLGSVYVGRLPYVADDAREYFGMPTYVLPLMLLCLGYPKTVPRRVPKLPPAVIGHREQYRPLSDDDLRTAFDEKYGAFDGDARRYFGRVLGEALEAEEQGEGEWLEGSRARMAEKAVASNAEFVFKVRYRADLMVETNAAAIDIFKNAGFDCFR